MKYTIALIVLLFCGLYTLKVQSQDIPDDLLSKDYFSARREKLRTILPPNSVAVFFSNPVRNRANDVDYVYHQDPDFYYLTGYREANSVLLIFKDKQAPTKGGDTYNEIIFVNPRDALRELWTGRRLGKEGVRDQLGFDQSFDNQDFKRYDMDFSKFDKILFFDFKNDVRNDKRDSADLYELIRHFKAKVKYPSSEVVNIKTEPMPNNIDLVSLDNLMVELRGVKSPEEIALLKKAILISCVGQVEVMKAIKPGMSEREIQGIHEYVYKKYQAEDLGYPSIVGSGHNGCILHYIENYKPSVSSKEMILMDLGAEFHGYTADITRTIPISGKFSTEQRQIYDLVLKAQEEAMKICKAGVPISSLNEVSRNVINEGLVELGILKSETEANSYFPHGLTHHIGLDVHDRGGRQLVENNAITIEPGIYIPENSPCLKKWWGIAVRIEDDYLVQQNSCELLSGSAPRKAEDIEAMMKQPSPLDNFILPEIGQ